MGEKQSNRPPDAKEPKAEKKEAVPNDINRMVKILPNPAPHPSYTKDDRDNLKELGDMYRYNLVGQFIEFRDQVKQNQAYLAEKLKPVLLAKQSQFTEDGKKLLEATDRILSIKELNNSELANIDLLQARFEEIMNEFTQFPHDVMIRPWDPWDHFGEDEEVVKNISFDMKDFGIRRFSETGFNELRDHLTRTGNGGYHGIKISKGIRQYVFSGEPQ